MDLSPLHSSCVRLCCTSTSNYDYELEILGVPARSNYDYELNEPFFCPDNVPRMSRATFAKKLLNYHENC